MGFLSSIGKVASIGAPIVGDLINPVAGAVTAGIGGFLGARDQNQANSAQAAASQQFQSELTNRQLAFSAKEAKTSRDWQAHMSNTAHQREIIDLRKAGLNPILSGTGGMGASSPAGATAQASSAAPGAMARIENANSPAIASALDAQRTIAQTRNAEADTSLKQTQAQEVSSRIPVNAATVDQLKATIDKTKADTANTEASTQLIAKQILTAIASEKLTIQQAAQSLSQTHLNNQEKIAVAKQVEKYAQEISQSKSSQALIDKQAEILGYSAYAAKTAETTNKTLIGEAATVFGTLLSDLIPAMSASKPGLTIYK